MDEIAFLPRVLIGRTEHGSRFVYDRTQGVMAEGPVIGWGLRPISAETLRGGYPDLWWTWTRLAALLPVDAPRFTVSNGDGSGNGNGGGNRAA